MRGVTRPPRPRPRAAARARSRRRAPPGPAPAPGTTRRFAAVGAHDALRHRQAEPRAARLGREERLEDTLDVGLGNAGPVVGHGEHDLPGVATRAQLDPPAARRRPRRRSSPGRAAPARSGRDRQRAPRPAPRAGPRAAPRAGGVAPRPATLARATTSSTAAARTRSWVGRAKASSDAIKPVEPVDLVEDEAARAMRVLALARSARAPSPRTPGSRRAGSSPRARCRPRGGRSRRASRSRRPRA